jgi:uncharacterized protein (DUF305 family)
VENSEETLSTSARQPAGNRSSLMMAAAVLVAIVSVIAVAWAVLRTAPPGESSVEAGFARDMAEHHNQAVEMALIIQQRTEHDDLRFMATDMMLVQQAQIGQMRGWLDVWGLHPSSDGTKMEWMGHPTTGLMPGMATPEQIQQLNDLPVPEAEDLFLELMIIHHQSGVEMADAALERSDNGPVTTLAEGISITQTSEIENLQRMRERLGLERVEVPQQIHDHD